MDGRDVLKALLHAAADNHVTILKSSPVTAVRALHEGFEVTVGDVKSSQQSTYTCTNLVIAAGGASYPTTGSDGSLLSVLERDLGISVEKLRPALAPVYVQNYPFSELSGISFKNAGLKVYGGGGKKVHEASGDLLLTHKSFSGPLMLDSCRYISTGDRIEINFAGSHTARELTSRIKEVFSGNSRTLSVFLAEEYDLPKRFTVKVLEPLGLSEKKLSSLTGSDIKAASEAFTSAEFSVSGCGSFREAMATKGGVALSAVSLSTMESKSHKGLYFIGEILDIDGDTGGYNLQFAYSSARTSLDSIYGK